MEPDRFIEGLARLGSDQWAAIVARHYDLSRRPEVEDARMACREVASSAGRLLAWKRAGDRAWAAAPGAGAITQAVPRKSADLEARAAARLAAGALTVRDLLGEARFELVYGPFADALPPG